MQTLQRTHKLIGFALVAALLVAGCAAPEGLDAESADASDDAAASFDAVAAPSDVAADAAPSPRVVEGTYTCRLAAAAPPGGSLSLICSEPVRVVMPNGAGFVLEMTWAGGESLTATLREEGEPVVVVGQEPPAGFHASGTSPLRLAVEPGRVQEGTYLAQFDAGESMPVMDQEALIRVAVFEDGGFDRGHEFP